MSERPRLMPLDTPDYMAPAWAGCIHWAIGNSDVLAAYRTETGDQWQPGATGLERMIDQACGADAAFVERFIGWVNERVWGSMDGGEDG